MKKSFPFTLRVSILIAALALIVLTFSFHSRTPTLASTCNWKVQFCGPTVAPTQNTNFLLRLIHSLPTTDKTCATGEVITGFNANGEMICTSVSAIPALRGPKGDKGPSS